MRAAAVGAIVVVSVIAFGALLACIARTPGAPTAAPDSTSADSPVAPPRNEFERNLARQPEPSADRAFTFDGEIDFGGAEKGSFRLAVTSGEHDGRAAWHVEQDEVHPAFPNGSPAETEHAEMWLSRDLRVLGGARTIVRNGVVTTTPIDAGSTRTIPFAAAVLYFRACPAEATARPDPVDYPVVGRVDADGTMLCTARTSDMYQVFVTLHGPARTPVEVKRFLGWHDMGTIVARAPK